MKCFVTGATGFVGGHLCERLAAEGHEVFALCRAASKRNILKDSGAKLIRGDLDSINVFAQWAAEVDIVFHLAAITKTTRNREFYAINTDGTDRLLMGLNRGGFEGRVVHLSSLAAGGPADARENPRRESDEDKPVSNYGKSKLEAEAILKRRIAGRCTYTILRPGAIYGPREHEIYEVLKPLRKHGIAVRIGAGVDVQMTHVDDVVDALVRAAFTPEASGQIYNVCDDAVWSFDEVINMAAESLGRSVRTVRISLAAAAALAWILEKAGRLRGRCLSPLTTDKIHELRARWWVADSSKIQKELDWRPKWDFPTGLAATIAWYRENDWL